MWFTLKHKLNSHCLEQVTNYYIFLPEQMKCTFTPLLWLYSLEITSPLTFVQHHIAISVNLKKHLVLSLEGIKSHQDF